MIGIIIRIFPVNTVNEALKEIFEKIRWQYNPEADRIVKRFFKPFREDLYFVLEYPYIDKFYRDSYYQYFSSKYNYYPRDTIRLTIFNKNFDRAELYNDGNMLEESFLGYVIIRPTMPKVIGRSMISPQAIKNHNFYVVLASDTISLLGKKLTVHAFPHASQDTETISCAETTIWSIMEYFSKHYNHYPPALPSDIIQALNEGNPQRMLPSSGLTIYQISMALKRFGFATMIYARDQYENFFEILSVYVESGLPLVLGLKTDKVAHAVLVIGHENSTNPYDKRKNIIIDDNYPPYQNADLETPGEYYDKPDYRDYKISHFVVPLYSRIYMDATKALALFGNILANKELNSTDILKENRRVLLTSSRSYKFRLTKNPGIDNNFKKKLLAISMPRFIWICELSEKNSKEKELATGIIILDATGTNDISSVIFVYIAGRIIHLSPGKPVGYSNVDYGRFPIYKNNLKGEWNEWKAN